MKVLVACEASGAVRDAFAALGHDSWSCDLRPAPGTHHCGPVEPILGDGWDLMIAHPPCTYLSVSGMHWTTRGLRDPKLTVDALAFVRLLWDAPIPKVCIENPVGVLSTRWRKPTQIVQPYEFGDDASKKTCLWLRGLPSLKATTYFPPRMVCPTCDKVSPYGSRDCQHCGAEGGLLRPRWSNQTNSGQNKLPPSKDRWALRSNTYLGIANAMATQFSASIPPAAPEFPAFTTTK